MKNGTLVITLIIVGALLAMAVMIKFATEIKVEDTERHQLDRDPAKTLYKFTGQMGVISLNHNTSREIAKRFPYVVAITRNYSDTWSFACFASIILVKWIITSAHCRKIDSTHRALLYYDFFRNHTHTYPILVWKVHEEYDNVPIARNDIAIAKLNFEDKLPAMKSSHIDEGGQTSIVASVWKTVATMDKRLFLTNDFESFNVKIAKNSDCLKVFGIPLDDSLFCVDMRAYKQDCFINEFGPIYSADKVVGIAAVMPKDCDIKYAIFTNVSYYTKWILNATIIDHNE
ncbi:hypothetical protein O0L34_g13355 [Tuta absoluta]|nr:hypothetical protein O0L34_g13355 [Tuta absoluta]